MKTGLVLEGGALRGLFSAGVMDVLMENNITFDGAIGVSAGAAFGCNYKSHQIGRAIRYNMRFAGDKRYCSFQSLVKTGDIYGARFAYHIVPTRYDIFDCKAYEENKMEFYAVCTDMTTGEPLYKKCDMTGDELFEWIRASASMPLVSRVVEVGGLKLLDGGMSDSIPLKYFQHIGYQRNLVILTQPQGYQKKKNKFLPLMRISLAKYPNMIAAMERRHLMYNEELDYVAQQEKTGDTLVIRPQYKIPISYFCHDASQMKVVYEMGREAAKERLNEIKSFILVINH